MLRMTTYVWVRWLPVLKLSRDAHQPHHTPPFSFLTAHGASEVPLFSTKNRAIFMQWKLRISWHHPSIIKHRKSEVESYLTLDATNFELNYQWTLWSGFKKRVPILHNSSPKWGYVEQTFCMEVKVVSYFWIDGRQNLASVSWLDIWVCSTCITGKPDLTKPESLLVGRSWVIYGHVWAEFFLPYEHQHQPCRRVDQRF